MIYMNLYINTIFIYPFYLVYVCVYLRNALNRNDFVFWQFNGIHCVVELKFFFYIWSNKLVTIWKIFLCRICLWRMFFWRIFPWKIFLWGIFLWRIVLWRIVLWSIFLWGIFLGTKILFKSLCPILTSLKWLCNRYLLISNESITCT